MRLYIPGRKFEEQIYKLKVMFSLIFFPHCVFLVSNRADVLQNNYEAPLVISKSTLVLVGNATYIYAACCDVERIIDSFSDILLLFVLK
jgi:putative effector of murein hydrolase LrgA (UPF0299 family)